MPCTGNPGAPDVSLRTGYQQALAIDLTQFAGLNVEQGAKPREAEDPYASLIAELKSGTPEAQARP